MTLPATTGAFGLLRAADFRLTDGRDATAAAIPPARWYFERETIAVPRQGLPIAGFHRGVRPLDDVRAWAGAFGDAVPVDYPPLVWVAAPERVDHARLAPDGVAFRTGDGTTPLLLQPRIALNRSYADATSFAFLAERTVRMRGTSGAGGFIARAIWPEDFALGPRAPPPRTMPPAPSAAESLRALMREMPRGGAQSPFAAHALWRRDGATDDEWTRAAVLAFVCNGAQGDDDEAHGGHFAIATGRIAADGGIADWLVHNFYSLDLVSEKGILAAPLPLDNYQGDLNAGQSWYRPSYALVAILDGARAPSLVQSALWRVYNQLWRHQLGYYHPSDNCTSISVDVLRALGLPVAARGPSGRCAPWAALPWVALRERSLAKGKLAFDYLAEDQTRLMPAAAIEEVYGVLLRIATRREPPGGRLGTWLAQDLRALAFLRIPQIPSSRAFGDAPAISIAEYRARWPADPADAQTIPLPPRPFPEHLRDDDLLPPPRRPSDRAATTLALLGALIAAAALIAALA